MLAPGEPCDCCKSSLICSENNVYLLFRNNDANARNSYISKSIDGGLSFISTADMDDYSWMLNSCPSTTPRGVVLGDSLCVVKRSGASGNNEIVYSNVNATDLNYSYNRNIDSVGGIIQDYPEISANGDTIVVVWQDNRTGMQNCYINLSIEGPSNFSGSISFTDSSIAGQKLDPDVVYSNGKIHLVYLDDSQHKIVYVKASIDLANKINEINDISSKGIVKTIDIL